MRHRGRGGGLSRVPLRFTLGHEFVRRFAAGLIPLDQVSAMRLFRPGTDLLVGVFL